MAGEWLKFEANTPEKPEVFAMTIALGWDDPDLTIGKLLKVWRWFDQHTINGNAHTVTLPLLDRISGVSGFAQAMCDVGWLVKCEVGYCLPHFDRHNGKTAKDRALTAKRVANHKANDEGNAKGNAGSVSSPLPREEKRREEKSLKSKAESATATRLPADWSMSEEDAAFCIDTRPELSALETANRFRDYWIAQPGAKGRKVDWHATWRNWVRSQRAPQARASPGYQTAADKSKAVADALTGRSQHEPRFIDIN